MGEWWGVMLLPVIVWPVTPALFVVMDLARVLERWLEGLADVQP